MEIVELTGKLGLCFSGGSFGFGVKTPTNSTPKSSAEAPTLILPPFGGGGPMPGT